MDSSRSIQVSEFAEIEPGLVNLVDLVDLF